MFYLHLRLDFTRGGDRRCQIFANYLAGLDRDYSLAALLHGEADDRQQDNDDGRDQRDFFRFLHQPSIPNRVVTHVSPPSSTN